MPIGTLARGLLRPFRRDQKNDFASGSGRELFQARASEVLGTRATSAFGPGELRWRPAFGSRLHLLRHKRITPITRELARFYAQEALGRWDRRCVVTSCTVDKNAAAATEQARRSLIVHITFAIVDRRVAGSGQVLATGLTASTVLPPP